MFSILNLYPGSVVGIATRYGLDGPQIESRYGKISHTLPDRPWGRLNLLYNGYRATAGRENGQGVALTNNPNYKKEWNYITTILLGIYGR